MYLPLNSYTVRSTSLRISLLYHSLSIIKYINKLLACCVIQIKFIYLVYFLPPHALLLSMRLRVQ